MDTLLKAIQSLLPAFAPEKTLKTATKEKMLNFMKDIQNTDETEFDTENVQSLIQALEKKIINKKIKEEIQKRMDDLLIEVNLTINNNTHNNITIVNTEHAPHDDLLNVELKLDSEIEKYNKYTKKNPMLGVSWNTKLNKWIIINKELHVNTKNGKLEASCQIIINKIIGINNHIEVDLKLYKNYSNKLVSYIYNDTELFDIYHIFLLLNIKRVDVKYNKIKHNIIFYGF